jgi:hypothetical protein
MHGVATHAPAMHGRIIVQRGAGASGSPVHLHLTQGDYLMLTFVVSLFAPQPKSVLEELRADYMQSLLIENERLCRACADARVALAHAYEIGTGSPTVAPIEEPSPAFSASMGRAERRHGSRLVKLFTA